MQALLFGGAAFRSGNRGGGRRGLHARGAGRLLPSGAPGDEGGPHPRLAAGVGSSPRGPRVANCQNRNPIPTPSVEGWRLMVAIF